MRTRILVIDDEESMCEILRFNLAKDGYDVDVSYSAEEALTRDLEIYSLFIVDIMMDRISGLDFAGRIRSMPSVENTPIIFCSALAGDDDKVMGLNIGADDYITKPFNLPEVKARIRAVLRRCDPHRRTPGFRPRPYVAEQMQQPTANPNLEADIIYKTLRIDRNRKVCAIDGVHTELTRTEYDMLLFFITHPDRVYSREEIIDHVWGNDVVISSRTIDTNITRLRKKIGEYGNNIITRQGFGYGFRKD